MLCSTPSSLSRARSHWYLKSKLKSEKIWKIWRKSKLNSKKIWKIWKKGKLNSEIIWKILKIYVLVIITPKEISSSYPSTSCSSLVICPFLAILFPWGAPSIITFLTKVSCFSSTGRYKTFHFPVLFPRTFSNRNVWNTTFEGVGWHLMTSLPVKRTH
jgi:hypothetical protein